mmetsp:Transcript_10414/g.17796  ORF Transcript_10414/g.17796 Transcript_10414/m.17796 type:complete len:91 (+) Transcript_10414:114-386(+)
MFILYTETHPVGSRTLRNLKLNARGCDQTVATTGWFLVAETIALASPDPPCSDANSCSRPPPYHHRNAILRFSDGGGSVHHALRHTTGMW